MYGTTVGNEQEGRFAREVQRTRVDVSKGRDGKDRGIKVEERGRVKSVLFFSPVVSLLA